MDNKKRALVCGAGGFIGGHLVKFLKNKSYFVRGIDIKEHEFAESQADEFLLLDLRKIKNCKKALFLEDDKRFDEVYQLAADMGGMGFIQFNDYECLHNNVLINLNMVEAAGKAKVKRYFYSSSVCVYRDMKHGEPQMSEDEAYPAMPDNEYGWEKLYSEHVLTAGAKKYGIEARIARFQNCYGPEGTWQGGREKAPAAISRKIAEIKGNNEEIEVWGDGNQTRNFIYIDDLINGIYILMQSDEKRPVNIGTDEYVTINQLVNIIAEISGKKIKKVYDLTKPVGVESRNFSHERIKSLGWNSLYSLRKGMEQTCPWIEEQVINNKKV